MDLDTSGERYLPYPCVRTRFANQRVSVDEIGRFFEIYTSLSLMQLEPGDILEVQKIVR